MTLLVLDIKLPHDVTPGRPLSQALLGEWPTYLAFATSFATILIMWVNHHGLFTHIGRGDDGLLFSNGLRLLGQTPHNCALSTGGRSLHEECESRPWATPL